MAILLDIILHKKCQLTGPWKGVSQGLPLIFSTALSEAKLPYKLKLHQHKHIICSDKTDTPLI